MTTTTQPTYTDYDDYDRARLEHNEEARAVLNFFTGWLNGMTENGYRRNPVSLAMLVDELEQRVTAWNASRPEWQQ